MARMDIVTVEVKANITVDKATAETCLKLVEMYVNQNGTDILGHTKEDGSVSFEFVNQLGEGEAER